MSNKKDIYDLSNVLEKYPLDNITDDINKYYGKAKKKVLDTLISEYKMDKDAAQKVQESIDRSVRSEMMTKYKSPELFGTYEELTIDKKSYIVHLNEYIDFVDWMFTALTVPFYQSFGDTLGYKNGEWEFNRGEPDVTAEFANELIYEFISLGGINDISLKNWVASDDTVLYMATYRVLTDKFKTIEDFGKKIKEEYIKTIPVIENRDPGDTTMAALEKQKIIEWNELQYDRTAKGAGAAMRSGCIGIFYPGSHNRKKLVVLAIESSRITHNSAIAILGSVVAALFTAYALEKIDIIKWPHKLLKLLESNIIDEYIQQTRPKEYDFFRQDKTIFYGKWKNYTNFRFSGIKLKTNLDRMMQNPVQRFEYFSQNFSKGCDTPGACGDDSTIMAYDALLESGNVLEKIIVYSILHPGDSDTVGSIALSWFGAYYHSGKNQIIIEDKFQELEFYNELVNLFGKNISRMMKVYFYDLYLNTAKKYIKQLDQLR